MQKLATATDAVEEFKKGGFIMKNELKEFLDELKHNQNINYAKNLKNRIDIDYVIKRIEAILKSK